MLKVKSLKSAALRTNLVKFKEKVEEREDKTIADLEQRRIKRCYYPQLPQAFRNIVGLIISRKATKSEFLAAVTSILEDQAAIPQPVDLKSSDTIFDALSGHHQSLKSASLHLLRTVASYYSLISKIDEEEMVIGDSWGKEVLDVEEQIKNMAEKTAVQLERFFKSKNGGWRVVTERWERRVARLLKDAPVPDCDDDEDNDH